MPRQHERRPVLVVGADGGAGERLVAGLRGRRLIAVWIDDPDAALEMMQVVEFAAVVVHVDAMAAWGTCWRIVARAACPVVVVTHFLARDRHFRDPAFRVGVSGYVSGPDPAARLGEMLARLAAGETALEAVNGAAFCEC